MSDLSNGWLAKNQQQKFPLDPRATGLTDDGRPLPDGLIADLSLTGYMRNGTELFITAVHCNATIASVVIGYRHSSGIGDFTVVTVARGAKTVNSDKLAVLPFIGTGGYTHNSGIIAFGDPNIIFSGVFSSPEQTRLAASTYRYVQIVITQPLPSFSVTNLDSEVRFHNLLGTVTLESGLDMKVSTVELLSRDGIPLLTATDTPKLGILINGNVANNLMYLPRSNMADEDDCSAADYPPAIKTIGGVTPKATPKGGEMLIEFSAAGLTGPSTAGTAVDGYTFTLIGDGSPTSYTPELTNNTTIATKLPFGTLCKTPAPKPVPVATTCAGVVDEICNGVHTFGQIPVDWSLITDLPTSSSTPRLKPNGDPCPALETLEDELITDYGVEFGNCFAPVARGQSICQRWYSRRVWAFDQTTQKDRIQIGSLGMSYAPLDWTANQTNLYAHELKAAFLGMPLRTYLNRSILATFRLEPSGVQSWSHGLLFSANSGSLSQPFLRPVTRCLGAIILDAHVDAPFGTDFKQPPSAKDDGLRKIESKLTFGIAHGSMSRPNDFVAGRYVVRTGYWLVHSGNNTINPAQLLLETSDLGSRTVVLSVFAQRDPASHEIYGTVGWTIPNLPLPITGTYAFRTAAWDRWAGEQSSPVTPQTSNRLHIGFSIGPNTTIMALEA